MSNCSKQKLGEYEFEESPNVSDIINYSVKIKFNSPGFFNLGRHIKSLYEPKIEKINLKIDGRENIQESIFKLLEKYVEDNEDLMFISPHKITVSESKKNITGQRMVKYTVVALDEDCYENISETTEDGKRLSYTKPEPVNKPIKHNVTSQDEIDKLLSKGGKIEREYWATLDFSRSVDNDVKESDIIPELMKLFPEDEIKDIYIENIGNSFIKNRELRQDESTENKNI
ncbi:MAG: hypothetical protein KAS90_01650, partial [Candidatus Aenigmarchaeota archaeon]|nr:hypothetical protein [Candidatus Aenigmarchaeota archaeon]